MNEVRALKAQLRALEHRLDERAKKRRQDRDTAHGGSNAPTTAALHAEPPGPDNFLYKGITITPGGYIALDSVFRTRWLGNDVAISYNTIPFGNFPAAHVNEFRFSARASRPTLLIQGDVNPSTHLTGYTEIDFLGAAQTANSNQSNSYNPRIRHLFTSLDLDDFGLHVLAGQTWTLATSNSYRIRPDTALTPPQINSRQIPGFFFPRQPQIRVTKDFGKEVTVAFSAESPATTFQALGTPVFGTTSAFALPGVTDAPTTIATPASGGLFNTANTYSFNRAPDFLAKAAWDSTILDHRVHLEGFGLLRDLTDRNYWGNHSVWGGGGGGTLIVAVLPKILDFQASAMSGYGISRYGAANLADATTSLTGAVLPAHQRLILLGGTLHVTEQTDLWAFAGGEFQSANPQFALLGKTLYVGGLGNYLYSNLGCEIETPAPFAAPAATACTGQTKDVRELTGGIWHTIYAGDFGKLKAGVQYAYTQRDGFLGIGGSPKGTENSVYISFRYFPF